MVDNKHGFHMDNRRCTWEIGNMIHGINNENSEQMINARLNGQSGVSSVVTNPIGNKNPYNKETKFNLIDVSDISQDAVKIFQREQDVKEFTKLALAGMNDEETYNQQVEELFAKGVVNPFMVDDTETLAQDLANNEEFLKDIDFSML